MRKIKTSVQKLQITIYFENSIKFNSAIMLPRKNIARSQIQKKKEKKRNRAYNTCGS